MESFSKILVTGAGALSDALHRAIAIGTTSIYEIIDVHDKMNELIRKLLINVKPRDFSLQPWLSERRALVGRSWTALPKHRPVLKGHASRSFDDALCGTLERPKRHSDTPSKF